MAEGGFGIQDLVTLVRRVIDGNEVQVDIVAGALLAGGATEATLAAINAVLNAIDIGIPASVGQAAMAASMPVTMASDQTDVPITLDSEQVAISDADAYTTPTHTAVNVTTGTGAVLASNANRLYALLVNDSDTTIYIKLGVAAVANQGIRLNANGGNYEMSAMLGNLYTGAINGIHGGTGNKALLMTEGV